MPASAGNDVISEFEAGLSGLRFERNIVKSSHLLNGSQVTTVGVSVTSPAVASRTGTNGTRWAALGGVLFAALLIPGVLMTSGSLFKCYIGPGNPARRLRIEATYQL